MDRCELVRWRDLRRELDVLARVEGHPDIPAFLRSCDDRQLDALTEGCDPVLFTRYPHLDTANIRWQMFAFRDARKYRETHSGPPADVLAVASNETMAAYGAYVMMRRECLIEVVESLSAEPVDPGRDAEG